MFETKGTVSVVKWMDSKLIVKLRPTVLICHKTGVKETLYCPNVVSTYNKIMGGVVKFDQLHERYGIYNISGGSSDKMSSVTCWR